VCGFKFNALVGSCNELLRAVNLHAMRMGPGKHLQGRTLMNGLVKPEEFDYFHEVGFSALILSRASQLHSSLSPKSSLVQVSEAMEMVCCN